MHAILSLIETDRGSENRRKKRRIKVQIFDSESKEEKWKSRSIPIDRMADSLLRTLFNMNDTMYALTNPCLTMFSNKHFSLFLWVPTEWICSIIRYFFSSSNACFQMLIIFAFLCFCYCSKKVCQRWAAFCFASFLMISISTKNETVNIIWKWDSMVYQQVCLLPWAIFILFWASSATATKRSGLNWWENAHSSPSKCVSRVLLLKGLIYHRDSQSDCEIRFTCFVGRCKHNWIAWCSFFSLKNGKLSGYQIIIYSETAFVRLRKWLDTLIQYGAERWKTILKLLVFQLNMMYTLQNGNVQQ